MDLTIAKWHISVQRSESSRGRGQLAHQDETDGTRLAQQVQRERQLQAVARQREQAQEWFALHGGH
ncbi:MAG TPA: hypothetical protein VKY74_09125 [Chloroflexia bacterium]|nr:hypothetical protein [Chloroflexia bacterium]